MTMRGLATMERSRATADGPDSRDAPDARLSTSPTLARRAAGHAWGWLFTAPALVGLMVFLVVPIVVTLWVSTRNWTGLTPLDRSTPAGLGNYRDLVVDAGLTRTAFATAVRNNLYYVLGVVPAQTALAFVLAVAVNRPGLRARSWFRTAFYFPSITGSVAMALVFTFMFRSDGFVNWVLPGQGTNWLDNADGVVHGALGVVGVDAAPAALRDNSMMGLSLWEWLSGPSVAMVAVMALVVWQTTGTMMLIFLAGLQGIPTSVEDAAAVDGATRWQVFRHVTVPLMRPTIAFVVMLGLIFTWQVFDQIYVITKGGPRNTTTTPAYQMYFELFDNSAGGVAAAIAVLLFVVIIGFTVVQRRVSRGARW
jgi:multiple sugar transport system permease protein